MKIKPLDNFTGDYEPGMILTLRSNPGLRRIRLLSRVEGRDEWVFEDAPARMWGDKGPDDSMHKVLEDALRLEFVPEEVTP